MTLIERDQSMVLVIDAQENFYRQHRTDVDRERMAEVDEAETAQPVFDDRVAFGARQPASRVETETNVLLDGLPGEDAVVLGNQRRQTPLGIVVRDVDGARGRR